MASIFEVQEPKTRVPKYTGPSIVRMINLLKCLTEKDLCFSELYRKCDIRYKRAYLNYLHVMLNLQFVTKKRIQYNVFYCLTEKGKILIDMFRLKSMNSEKNQATLLMKEKKALRELAGKIKNIPEKFTDGYGNISETKILTSLIDYHRGRI